MSAARTPASEGSAPEALARSGIRDAGDGSGAADDAAPDRPDVDLMAKPGVALAAIALGGASLVRFGLDARGLIAVGLCAALVTLAAFDLEQRRIPNRIVFPALGVLLIAQLAFFPGHGLEWIGAGLGAGLLLLVPNLFRRGAVGMGDVKLAALLGVGLGGAVMLALLVGSLAAVPAAVWILVTRGSAARNETIPLGPFLALGGIVALFVADLPGA